MLEPRVPLNCEAARLTAYSPTVIVSRNVRLRSLAAELEDLFHAIAFLYRENRRVAALCLTRRAARSQPSRHLALLWQNVYMACVI